MSTFMIGMFLALGGGAWVFSKLQRSTGGANTAQSALFAAIAGAILLLLTFMIFSYLPE